ncbi:hypothetical protein L6164_034759 [Bauhinia variegata]|uniref:Uncharacterized protein n=1 Tax=Bauhinia variegata TaxID=167791 RepID=A0ACB9KX65_BAUVA|nr:hypothetical protein L6164_034759 [Bauhinia variegata]
MDALCLKSGICGIAPAISISGCSDVRSNPSQVSTVGRSNAEKSPQKSVFSRFSFSYPLKSLWPGGNGNNRYNGLAIDDSVLVENHHEGKGAQEDGESETLSTEDQNENWVFKILHVKSIWTGEKGKVVHGGVGNELGSEEKGVANDKRHRSDGDEEEIEEEECDACRVPDDDEEEIKFDRDSFSRMLRRVSLAEVKLYAQMSYLGNLAYCIPKIKPGNLLKNHGLRFVTSSIKKRELATAASAGNREIEPNEKKEGERKEKNSANKISASAAYQIAASAASYLHAQTRSILPFKFSKTEVGEASVEGSIKSIDTVNMINTEMASLKATTDSVTAVVAAEEEVKQAVAEDLSSTRSSPCEWFVCDDDMSGTRYFVIQGSETLASWLANLFFEPIQFEEMGVRVHRGIYEAAKGMYQQMLPEVRAHLISQGSRATFRFTGHSLGGSLAMLVNLMLLIRGEVPISSLLPVVAFGAPFIMCGGDSLLHKLGLPRSHIKSITMHRDIVPRAFSCNYNPVAGFLKAINRKFRSHPCLNNQKILFGPMGELLILQPDEKFSPEHHLLPSGSGLYLLSEDSNNADKHLHTALLLFMNTPHPLEILKHTSAYGSGGTIQRDHDMNSYFKSLRTVIRQQLNSIRKASREHRRKVWWPLVMPVRIDTSIVVGRSMVSVNIGQDQSAFSGILQTGRESLKRFSRLVASQHMHLVVVLLFPARLLLLGAFSITNLR